MRLWRPVVSAIMLIAGIAATSLMDISQWSVAVWYAVAYLPVGLPVIHEAIEGAMHDHDPFSEFMLMSIASIGAFAIGEYPEAVAVMLLYCIGEAFQDKAVERARGNIASLMALRPDHANVVAGDGTVTTVAPDSVATGQTIEVRPGERVPLDGTLLTDDAAFDTAALTGESLPRLITTGQEVMAGMIATTTTVRLRTLRPASESAVSRILRMVEEASDRKAPAELFIHRFAHVYTPVVIVLALLTLLLPWGYSLMDTHYIYSFSQWLHRALVFLVISCPCALVISVPLSYFAGIGAASRRGILFKGGNCLDAVTALRTVVFDKTGTLTTGQFTVTHTEGLDADTLSRVAAIEATSSHPIARAICRHAGVSDTAADVSDIPGYGLTSDGWLVGTPRLLRREGITYPATLDATPGTIVAVAHRGTYLGHILLSDTPKDDAHSAVQALRREGITTVGILSGDRQALVDNVATALGVDHATGDLLPEGKVARIEQLKREGRVAFVGDGINDAPVLALSDVGIAMGAMGADMAIETADVIIQTDQPSKVAEAIAIGRRTRRIVRQNIIFAIAIKVAVMLLGVVGMANLWEAVFADSGVALLAVLNATRVFAWKKE